MEIGEGALASAPAMAGKSDVELAAIGGRCEALRERLSSFEAEVSEWMTANADEKLSLWPLGSRAGFSRAAWKVAIERELGRHGERPYRHPLGGARRSVLGEARFRAIMGESRRLEGWLEQADTESLRRAEQDVGDVLAGLEGAADVVGKAEVAVAAVRERGYRELLAAIEERVGRRVDASPVPAPDALDGGRAADPIKRNSAALGKRRCDLLARAATRGWSGLRRSRRRCCWS